LIRTVPTGDLGLDVLLGGGWRLVTRLPERESTSVLVRGGSGAGKTIMGFHVALELARALGGDVAVGCVEILPSEYVAQLHAARPSLEQTRVAQLPLTPASKDGPRVFVGLLPDIDPDEPDLVAGLESLARDVEAAGGKPVAFIVDSLIEGYGIGSSAPRLNVDAVMKFAAHAGYGLVLCEEVVTDTPSPWVFAADTVLQLGVESRERGRWIEVRKHRFGPCATGRHELDVVGRDHPEVFPSAAAWLSPHLEAILVAHKWAFGDDDSTPRVSHPLTNRADIHGSLVVVAGNHLEYAAAFAQGLMSRDLQRSRTLVFQLDPLLDEVSASVKGNVEMVRLPSEQGAVRALRRMIEHYGAARSAEDGWTVGRVVIGDIAVVFVTDDASRWADAIRTFATIVIGTRHAIAVVTCDGSASDGGEARSRLTKHADATVEVRPVIGGHVRFAVNQRWPLSTDEFGIPPRELTAQFLGFSDTPRKSAGDQ
jgi:KaiC/GvpD/RAD55 family RecA-like ATPase